jgi:hypothetical protein
VGSLVLGERHNLLVDKYSECRINIGLGSRGGIARAYRFYNADFMQSYMLVSRIPRCYKTYPV